MFVCACSSVCHTCRFVPIMAIVIWSFCVAAKELALSPLTVVPTPPSHSWATAKPLSISALAVLGSLLRRDRDTDTNLGNAWNIKYLPKYRNEVVP